MPSSQITGRSAAGLRRTILLDARLVGPRGDALCRIHAMSGREMTAQTCTLLGRNDWVRVDLPNGQSASGQVDWTAHDHVGVTFAVPIGDLDQFLARCFPDESTPPALSPRTPHFVTSCPVDLWQGSTAIATTMIEISTDGARFATPTTPRLGRPLLLSGPGLPALVAARLCWASAGEAGVIFEQPLPFDTLAPWLDTRALRFAQRG